MRTDVIFNTADETRRVGVIGRERSWRERIIASLRGTGWQPSAFEDPPSNPMGFRAFLLHAPSFGQTVTSIIHRLTHRPPLFVFEDAPSSGDRARWIKAGATAVLGTRETPTRFLARLWRTTIRRNGSRRRVTAGPFKVDWEDRRAWAGDRELELTRTELAIFHLLVQRANRLVSHDDIRETLIGGADRVETSAVRSHMRNLRRKLGNDAVLLETVAPRHYRLRSRRPVHPSAARAKNRATRAESKIRRITRR